MKKILVPIDFSNYSANAVRYAAYFAKVKGMSIKLLHVVEEPKNVIPFIKESRSKKEEIDQLVETTKDNLARIAAMYRAEELPVEDEVRRTKGSVAKEILNEPCDLIIMGRKRTENEEELFAGSVAEKVIRLSGAPVITVGELRKDFKISNIVFASDFEDKEVDPIIRRVLDLAEIFNAQIHFLYVALNREFLSASIMEAKVQELISKYDLENHKVEIFVAPTEEEGIYKYSRDINADLIALCTHGRTGIMHFFLGSVSEEISLYSEIPVLTYNISKNKVKKATEPITRDRVIRIKDRSRKNI